MNIVDILILAVLAFSLLAGMHKGFITSLLSTFGFVGSWFGARLVYERIANLALSNTTLMAVLNQYLEPVIDKPLAMDSVCLFCQTDRALPFRLTTRFALARTGNA